MLMQRSSTERLSDTPESITLAHPLLQAVAIGFHPKLGWGGGRGDVAPHLGNPGSATDI